MLPSELALLKPLVTTPQTALNVLFFRRVDYDGKTTGIPAWFNPGFRDDPAQDVVIVGTEDCGSMANFLNVVAHEVGHALGLSRRKSVHPNLNVAQSHDGPVFPARYGTVPLMYFHTHPLAKWLRHEEWEPSFQNAFPYRIP